MTVGPPAGDPRELDLAAPAKALRAVRAAARETAGRALAECGFTAKASPDAHWVGTLSLPRSGVILPVAVRLPISFPDALPKVAVAHGALPRRIPHVSDGGVCLLPASNVLLDADRPEDLVADALRLATDVLDAGLMGETAADFDAEFEAYWSPTDFTRTLSCVDANAAARSIAVCQLTGGPKLIDGSTIVAERAADAELWAKNVGAKVGSSRLGLFVPVNASVPLPLPDQGTSVSQIAQLIAAHATPEALQLLRDAVKRADYPQWVFLSMPQAPAGTGRRLAAVRINRPDSRLLKEAACGFRPGRVPAAHLLSRIGRSSVDRISLERVDSAHLVARGGSAADLGRATVVVIGVGAVGSEVARNLAALGVGHIRLVDPDEMSPANVHRHALGMESTGYKKAVALTVHLSRSFPHLAIDCRSVNVELLLENEPSFLLEADLIVLATGEETLERRLNRLLQVGPPRLHTWLEPLGIGGHSFACGDCLGNGHRDRPLAGCFECLYRPDAAYGLINRTALTGPGQEIRESLAGCAGTFSPFSPLDARRTAIDAAELAARILTGVATTPVLASWRGMHTGFERAGYQLSPRARQITPGARVEVLGPALARSECKVCGVYAIGAPSEGGTEGSS